MTQQDFILTFKLSNTTALTLSFIDIQGLSVKICRFADFYLDGGRLDKTITDIEDVRTKCINHPKMYKFIKNWEDYLQEFVHPLDNNEYKNLLWDIESLKETYPFIETEDMNEIISLCKMRTNVVPFEITIKGIVETMRSESCYSSDTIQRSKEMIEQLMPMIIEQIENGGCVIEELKKYVHMYTRKEF